jgi:hypothetical protein
MDLYGLKEDSMEVAKIGASALAGAAIAKIVVEKGSALIAPLPSEDATKGKPENADSAIRKYVMPLVPIAVGVAVHSYGKMQYPIAAPGVAAGMVAVGLGKLIGAVVGPSKKADDAGAMVAKYVPFAGLGETYDTGLLGGFGYSYGAGVDRYMMAGAPTQVQSLMGMPVQVQSLNGLGSTIVGGSAPLSASLM